MKCQQCGQNPAVVHTLSEVDGKKTEKFLCIACAQKHSFGDLISIHDFIKAFWPIGDPESQEREVDGGPTCSRCGMELSEMRKTGQVGCANCWKDFHATLEPMLQRIHGRAQHSGKLPKKARDPVIMRRAQIARLKQDLTASVAREEFEQAARLRDEIRALEAREA